MANSIAGLSSTAGTQKTVPAAMPDPKSLRLCCCAKKVQTANYTLSPSDRRMVRQSYRAVLRKAMLPAKYNIILFPPSTNNTRFSPRRTVIFLSSQARDHSRPHGAWHFNSLLTARYVPFIGPNRVMAIYAYWEQV